MSKLLCFDIETAPIDGVEQYMGAIQAPANHTKPESIAKYVEEKAAEERDRAALDPDLGRIVALYFQLQGDPEIRGGIARDEDEERALLTRWWAFVRKASNPLKVTYSGYNIASFDLPFLLRRSMLLKIPTPHIRLGRYAYQMPDVQDMMLVFTMDRHEKFRMRSKDWWIKRLGLAGAEDGNTGAAVPALVALGDWDAVAHHCKQDVVKEVQMLEWLGLWS